MTRPPHILLVEAPYYTHIASELRRGAERALAAVGATHERIAVPGAFEIPTAIGIAGRASERFDGFVALGCVIRGETSHYELVCSECARGLQSVVIEHTLALGFGVLTVENREQALARASLSGRNKGGESARACLAMLELKRAFHLYPR
jgi:6,7-dimethyl-8-ribityllumazine synthase